MDIDRIGEIILIGFFLLWITIFAVLIFSNSTGEEKEVWKEMVEHSDDFTYSHISDDGERACFKLFDKDGKYLCEAVLYFDDERVNIRRSTSIILSRYSCEKLSHKMFELLYPKIPEDDQHKIFSNDGLIKRLKEMK